YGAALNGSATSLQASDTDTLQGGAIIGQAVSGLTLDRLYHWRFRLRYKASASPFAQKSRWLTMPASGWQEADLRTAAIGSGRIPESGAGSVLVTKSASNITLAWGPSCNASDTDYAVYEGTIGQYYSHV